MARPNPHRREDAGLERQQDLTGVRCGGVAGLFSFVALEANAVGSGLSATALVRSRAQSLPRFGDVEKEVFIRREIAQGADESAVHLPQDVTTGPIAFGSVALGDFAEDGGLDLLH